MLVKLVGFQGSVSIMAHSLGSVLSYDVLCNQPQLHAALNLPRPSSQSPEAIQQSKRARLSPIDTQVPTHPSAISRPSLKCVSCIHLCPWL
jgi:hypothetical protein